jgi:hypothetical protein
MDVSAAKRDPLRAMSLYGQAWADDVPIAAFKLGHLFEYGVQAADAAAGVINADSPKHGRGTRKVRMPASRTPSRASPSAKRETSSRRRIR